MIKLLTILLTSVSFLALAKEKETKETKPAVTCTSKVTVAKNKDKEMTVSDCKTKQGNVSKEPRPSKSEIKSK